MKQITINGKEYSSKLSNRSVKAFEKKTGMSIFKINKDNIGGVTFTDISDLCFSCIEEMDENEFDDLGFNEVVEVFTELVSGKK